MKPISQAGGAQFQLFQAHFDQMLNPDHPLVVLAHKIDWPWPLKLNHFSESAVE